MRRRPRARIPRPYMTSTGYRSHSECFIHSVVNEDNDLQARLDVRAVRAPVDPQGQRHAGSLPAVQIAVLESTPTTPAGSVQTIPKAMIVSPRGAVARGQ